MNKTIEEADVAAWLSINDNYLILTHIRPDGDTLGSAGGLTQGLRELGKSAYMLRNPDVTQLYARFVDEYWAPEDFTPEHIIAVDTATVELLPKNASIYKDKIALCIDHHGTNTMCALFSCVRPERAACGEIIFDILSRIPDIALSKKTADCLYVAISTDTGCFCYRNTTANTHRTAAALIEHGAASVELSKLLFRTKRRQRIILEGMVNSGIEFLYEGKAAIVIITREMMKASGANTDDIEDISNIATSIEGVAIGITIRELSAVNDCKISVRSSPPYDASELCRKFGGGGHRAAAGASFQKPVDEVKRDLLAVLDEFITGSESR